ncbi:hypothetical protein VF14_03250 [Nostoc linckia z18]|uniref:Uncharacterized protein n=2 Tax=Nostoc linckia TaxID=92942 RepID=A0A9Q5ZH31_NOSLI|nr:hypothetical protein [Nostoc linckia]PHK42396.1 hypothetical protein VF12_03265 [Nostoc linckia z15]PHK46904.1 hypothetical protein VF13_07890 [Nostoc linckia z16]PHJ69166.1 hypothetical protein VF02_00720 [Nostoc linckia z1]PHJ73317.1 hypothetical protein VF05_01735 [Nostoc linckia z3]PHJ78664.1 hypothetical protein VF03_00720 [Nostoc linckia z2]
MFIIQNILVEVKWWEHEEIYHWKAYQEGRKILDSQAHLGFAREIDATKHAELEVKFYLENQEDRT